MQRELSSFPLPPIHHKKLHQAGFTVLEDVVDIKPSELSKEINVSHEEALDILKLLRADDKKRQSVPPDGASRSVTALDMLKDETNTQCIITFSEQLDDILGGGVPLAKITEFCGAPGIGKTQICMQLSVDVQIPECFGGLAGEAVYIDTEGSFVVDRVADMARAALAHCQHIAHAEGSSEQKSAVEKFTLEAILSRVYYFRCHDYVQLLALVHLLPEFVQSHPKVKLVTIDSIAFHFRHDFEDLSLRTRLLNGTAQNLIRLASTHKLAVVLTNQMTTKVSADKSRQSHLVPALGESWGHASTVRVILYWQRNQRHAMLYKSPSQREAIVPYQITTGGVRDIAPPTPSDSSETTESEQQRKRPRVDS